MLHNARVEREHETLCFSLSLLFFLGFMTNDFFGTYASFLKSEVTISLERISYLDYNTGACDI